jgi:hypothetical protein
MPRSTHGIGRPGARSSQPQQAAPHSLLPPCPLDRKDKEMRVAHQLRRLAMRNPEWNA